MENWKFEFKTTDEWKPLEDGCWIECPVAILTQWGHKCRAKDLHDRKIGTICPMLKAVSNNEANNNTNDKENVNE